MVSRVYVEKKPGFDVEARRLARELRDILGIARLESVRLVNRYDVEGIDEDLFARCVPTVFSEPPSDDVAFDLPAREGETVFAIEPLPGQFDQRSDSASECIQLISQGARPDVHAAKVMLLSGALTDEDIAAIKRYAINPVEAREASLDEVATLKAAYPEPAPVEVVEGFTAYSDEELSAFIAERGLAMDAADIAFCRAYFRDEERRDPTIAEIRMIDTYWSDHCRHTTFSTMLDEVAIDDAAVQKAFDTYLALRAELGREEKPLCLMDIGTIGARHLKRTGRLTGLDESEEINACTVRVTVDVDGVDEDWLFLFKNETHNHPTEVEPFGGAATCIGGCIRDPLSGRSYVYQAMRVTGAANPLAPVSDTLPGKLPQRTIVTAAAAGYSSYGNQIGLATGQVNEIYHPGYAAKRMEIGAVVGATPADHVRRETPLPGDAIILLGGRTGRDGIGGATGSSKAHTEESIETCGAEVQKGNAPVERKIQRLFRRGDACRLIKRCNDFGAGGVSVAVGELADGLDIDLDRIPKKYDGLDGTELAISESQERMACAVAPEDVDEFLGYAAEENLEATVIATVTEAPRVRMTWHGDVIVDVSRAFLNSNGVPKHARVHVSAQGSYAPAWPGATFAERMGSVVRDLNVCSNKGLSERFDSTIGAATVLMPFGGIRQLTPANAMVAKLPVDGETTTCSGMAWGYNPYLSEANQFAGAYLAVVESVSKLVSAGFSRARTYLTFQEYFGSLRDVPERWGKPVASLLGALMAQIDLGVGSIGGKDSMSGSFEALDVPPTLVSFATACGKIGTVMSPEFKGAGHRVVRIAPAYRADGLTPETDSLIAALDAVEALIANGGALAVGTAGYGCGAEALFKMTLGNAIGLKAAEGFDTGSLFVPAYSTFYVELAEGADAPENGEFMVAEVGTTTAAYEIATNEGVVDLADLQEAWERPLESVFPYRGAGDAVEAVSFRPAAPRARTTAGTVAKPRVIIPVFPGNNCEFDTARAFERAGAEAHTLIINNLTPERVAESTRALVEEISKSQIVMIPGGFSGGDEPDGSAKFITAFFRAPEVTEAVRDLLQRRDGLMLGICNGFQALVKLGLVPFGDIRAMDAACPTLTFNEIGRHQSRIARTRIASTLSPWLSRCEVGDVHTVAVSHGEGRFTAPAHVIEDLVAAGQVATQYVGLDGVPSMDLDTNPNGSLMAIEGITSPDGRVFGKMGHSERFGAGTYLNIPDRTFQPVIEGGVRYFTD
ncbi:phosphoribosylformylglycinamidine synthase [Slackia exigua]|uniref:phosphoribosylformylglycinamidine synthase n=1 Tax=Slackia exigua TaxID=84109 RepID=UPI00254B162A|nr:phosphoribosylformylglycinamidine synthase [Slackia exigua]MDK7724083.1 phosphoribosylformylglycinamidine synthase [Slackia exigua]MDK7726013.1 phosphoribosylformylglycinamidine synthase [Slackia exigua]